MATWSANDLKQIGEAEEIDIASLGADGRLSKRTTIWVVRLGDGLYVRAYRGPTSVWYRGTQVRHLGCIYRGKEATNVTFEAGDPKLNAQIDAEYRSKYRQHDAQYVDPMVNETAHATTIKVVPR